MKQALWLTALAVASAAVIGVPALAFFFSTPLISSPYGPDILPFEVFGLCAAVVLLAAAYIVLRRSAPLTLSRALPVGLLVLISLHFAASLADFPRKPSDYGCYERAAQAVVAGENPWQQQSYLYPPLLAVALAVAYRSVAPVVPPGLNPWDLIFYIYQSAQLLLIVGAIYLCCRLARQMGFSRTNGALIVAALFVCNAPLLRTLALSQINLLVLDSYLVAMLCVESRPVLSGLAISLGAQAKLYPALLTLPWIITKRWLAALAALLGTIAWCVALAALAGGWQVWAQFLHSTGHYPRDVLGHRDSSLYAMLSYCWDLTGAGHGQMNAASTFVRLGVPLAMVLLCGWIISRVIVRERLFASSESPRTAAPSRAWASRSRLLGHSMDVIAFSLLMSPIVWSHHYVLATPLVLWALGARGEDKLWQVVLAGVLVLGMPTFYLFPLMYHRVAGLIMLLHLTRPRVLHDPKQFWGSDPVWS